jgi:hypothetical protein
MLASALASFVPDSAGGIDPKAKEAPEARTTFGEFADALLKSFTPEQD